MKAFWTGQKYKIKYSDETLTLTFPADVIPRGEEHGPEPQHQLAEKSSLRRLEDLHSFQSVQVDVDSYLCLRG